MLVLSARREIRSLIRDVLRPMALLLNEVTTIEQARAFCSGGIPHAIVHDQSLGGAEFETWRLAMLTDVPTLAFIQIADEGRAFEVHNVGERQFARVGREAIRESLPSALMFELARCG